MFCRLKQKFVPKIIRNQYQLQSYYCREDTYRSHQIIPSHTGPPVDLIEQLLQLGYHRSCSLNLELACGTGEFLLRQAQGDVQGFFVGVDYTGSVIQRAVLSAHRMQLRNVAFFNGTVIDFFAQVKEDEIFSQIWINFPDPWPKKRHHKRRLLYPESIPTICKKLQIKGLLATATDHRDLAIHHEEILMAAKELQPICPQQYTYISRYHQKALSRGKEIYYTLHQKN